MSIGGFEGWDDWCHVDPTEPDDDETQVPEYEDEADDDDDETQVPEYEDEDEDEDDDDDVFVYGVKA